MPLFWMSLLWLSVMFSLFILSAIVSNIIYAEYQICCILSCYPDYYYAGSHYEDSDCSYAVCNHTECQLCWGILSWIFMLKAITQILIVVIAMILNVNYSDCHCPDCRYAKCRGALKSVGTTWMGNIDSVFVVDSYNILKWENVWKVIKVSFMILQRKQLIVQNKMSLLL